MALARNMLFVGGVLGLAALALACSQPSAPSPSSAATPAAPPAAVATAAPQPPAAAPTAVPQPPAAAPTAAPKPAATTPPLPAPSPAASPAPTSGPTGISMADLAARARGISEYSFASRITAGGQTLKTRTYVKPLKMRQEMDVAGQSTILLLDLEKKVAYTVMLDQKMAMKVDFSEMSAEAELPGDMVAALPDTSKPSGTETLDGKSVAVYETSGGSGTTRLWIWTERGLPLKIESGTPEGKVVMEFTDYRFEPQPDSLFQLPPGIQLLEIPAGGPGGVPFFKP